MSTAISVLDTALIRPHLAVIRSAGSKPSERRRSIITVTHHLLQVALQDIPLLKCPLTSGTGDRGECEVFPFGELAFVFVLRAAMPMALAAWDLVPEAPMGALGIKRIELKDEIVAELLYTNLPPVRPRICVVLDGMVATACTTIAAIDAVKKWGGDTMRTIFVGLVGARQGVDALSMAHPDVPIFLAAIDPELDDRGYVRNPGVGDLGDMTFGTLKPKTIELN